MLSVQNYIQEFLQNQANKSQIEKSKKRFAFKPYYEKYSGMKITALLLRYSLPLLSIVTGSLWIASVMGNMIPIFLIAVLMSTLLVVLLEYSKNYLLTLGITDLYKGLKGAWLMVVLGLCCTVVSGFVSLKGIEHLHIKMDRSLSLLETKQQSQSDSLVNYFDTQIQATQKSIREYQASVSVGGKINVYNPTTATVLQNYSEQLQSLQEEKKTATDHLQKLQQEQRNLLATSNGFNLKIVIGIILVIEGLILFASWFPVHYDFKTQEQSHYMQNETEPSLTFAELLNLQQKGLLPESIVATKIQEDAKRSEQIGFQSQFQEQEERGKQETVREEEERQRLLDFLDKYKHIVEAIEKGTSYNEIIKKYKVSKSTIQNVRRCLRAVRAYA